MVFDKVHSDFASKLKKALVESGYEFREVPSEGELDSFFEQYRGSSSKELVKHWVDNNPDLPAKRGVDDMLEFLNWFYRKASKTELTTTRLWGTRTESDRLGLPNDMVAVLTQCRILRREGTRVNTKVQWVKGTPTRDMAYQVAKYIRRDRKQTARTTVYIKPKHKKHIELLLSQGKTPEMIWTKHLKEFGGLPVDSIKRYCNKVIKTKGYPAKFTLPLPTRKDEKEEVVSKVAKEIIAETDLGKRGREIEMGKWVETEPKEPTMKRTKPPKEKVVIEKVNEEETAITEEKVSANETNTPTPPDFGSEYLLKLIERQAELIEMQSEFMRYQRKLVLKAMKKRST